MLTCVFMVQDINDFSPVLTLTDTEVTRQETTAIGDVLSTAIAIDNDPQVCVCVCVCVCVRACVCVCVCVRALSCVPV